MLTLQCCAQFYPPCEGKFTMGGKSGTCTSCPRGFRVGMADLVGLCFWTQFLWCIMFWVDFFTLFLFFKGKDVCVVYGMQKNLQSLCGRNQLPFGYVLFSCIEFTLFSFAPSF